jgi:hypothetical protein
MRNTVKKAFEGERYATHEDNHINPGT